MKIDVTYVACDVCRKGERECAPGAAIYHYDIHPREGIHSLSPQTIEIDLCERCRTLLHMNGYKNTILTGLRRTLWDVAEEED